MDALERNLLWLGVEDYTGLWQAVAEASDEAGPSSIHEDQRQARQTIEYLLSAGLIDLFVCQEPLNNETVEIVPPELRLAILDEESSWVVPEEGGQSIRFATTDQGFSAYRTETGWTGE